MIENKRILDKKIDIFSCSYRNLHYYYAVDRARQDFFLFNIVICITYALSIFRITFSHFHAII